VKLGRRSTIRKHRRTIDNPWGLTDIELEVLEGLARVGYAKIVAAERGVEVKTIEGQLHSAKVKMRVRHKVLAILEYDRWLRRHGIVI
jgi:hypothetical protein